MILYIISAFHDLLSWWISSIGAYWCWRGTSRPWSHQIPASWLRQKQTAFGSSDWADLGRSQIATWRFGECRGDNLFGVVPHVPPEGSLPVLPEVQSYCWNFLSVFPDENRALFRQVSLDPLEPSSPSPGNPEKPSSPVTWLDSVHNMIQYDTQKYTKHPSRASVHLHSFYIFWYMHQCVGRHNITEAYWSALVGAKRVRLLRIH